MFTADDDAEAVETVESAALRSSELEASWSAPPSPPSSFTGVEAAEVGVVSMGITTAVTWNKKRPDNDI